MSDPEGRLRLGLLLAVAATSLRVAWALGVPTIPVGDFAMYRESANHLIEHGSLDGGFIYMPGLVLLLAALQALGGEIASAKLLGAVFGGLAAWPLYVLTAHVADGPRAPGAARAAKPAGAVATGPGSDRPSAGWLRRAVVGAPVGLVATLLYVVWPAGISLASVIGTDVPAAALLLLSLALLVRWGPSRPWLAAIAFGAATGLAAYVRAVSLPLTVVAAGYWLVRGAGLRTALARTAVSVGVALVVLAPWAVRNLRTEGELSFTDHHGGITALMGNYPNTEGTYTRSLNIMFKDLTGKTFLSQPHRETDRAAYAIAKDWIRFEPAWTAGMVALRLERLFAAEHGLLYWSLYRPGVLPPGAAAAWFGRHRAIITTAADVFYLFFAACVCAGLAFSIVERRWVVLLPAVCATLLAATYALFVAEPRYRVTTEALLFPVAGLGLHRLAALAVWAARRLRIAAATSGSRATTEGGDPHWRRGAIVTALIVAGLVAFSAAVVVGGEGLRRRHRWAVSLWRVEGAPRLAYWRGASLPASGLSPVSGTADGARLGLPAGSGSGGSAEADAEIVVVGVGRAVAPMRVSAMLEWSGGADHGAQLELGGAVAAGGSSRLEGVVQAREGEPGGLRVGVRLTSPRAGADTAVVIRDVRLERVDAPASHPREFP